MAHINPVVEMYRQPRPLYDYFHAPLRQAGHAGVDLYAERFTPIVASEDGVIHASGFLNRGAGFGVEIWHPQRAELTRYLHMPKGGPLFTVGASVKQGQDIGVIGCTGICNSPHTHYEIRQIGTYHPEQSGVSQGTPIDPLAEGILTNPPNSDAVIVQPPAEPIDIVGQLPRLEQVWPGDSTPNVAVKRLQALLAVAKIIKWEGNFRGLGWDGVFGPLTKIAVIAFQNSVGIDASGVVDEETHAALLGIND